MPSILGELEFTSIKDRENQSPMSGSLRFRAIVCQTLQMMNRAGIFIFLALSLSAAAAEFPATTITARRLQETYPLNLQTFKAEVEIDANLASTTLTMTFFNPSDRRLEGEIRFPISYGQNPSFFAMDVEGKMRDGVVVERSLARNVFDSLVRWNIDPGLLSWIDGERFSVRMFPIDGKKSKTIVVRYEEELKWGSYPKLRDYTLPLTMPQSVETFQLRVTAARLNSAPVARSAAFQDLEFREEAGQFEAETTLRDYRASQSLQLGVPSSSEPVLLTSRASSLEQYFYYNFDTPITSQNSPRQRPEKPEKVCLLWDQSTSGIQRDLEAELNFLTSYFHKLGDVDVELLPFHNSLMPRQTFEIRGGDWTDLRKRLADSVFDGGTRFDAFNLDEVDCDEILLFSDGAWTLGKAPIDPDKAPIFAVHSSSRQKPNRQLRGLCIESGGRFINLRHSTATDAVKMVETQPYRFMGVADADKPGGPIRSVYPSRPTERAGGSIAGLTSRELDEITLEFGYGREVVDRLNLPLKDWSRDTPLVKRIWARKKLADLESLISPAAAVREFAEEAGLVTEYTSSIVLDRVSDYINNYIEPPANEPQLLAEYRKFHGSGDAKRDHMAFIRQQFADKRVWWIKDWPWLEESNFFLAKNGVAYLEQRALREPNNATTRTDLKFIQEAHKRAKELRDEYTIRMDELRPKPYEAWLTKALQLQSEIEPLRRAYGDAYIKWVEKNEDYRRANQALFARMRDERRWQSIDGFVDPFASLDPGSLMFSVPSDEPETPAPPEDQTSYQGVVKILPWAADAAYLGALRPHQNEEDLERTYLQLRKNRLNDPFFYADVGDLLMNRGHEELAIRVLSNIAELGINDIQLLRMLGYRFLAIGKIDLAIEIFEQIRFINDNNPHVYRDLALCHIELGQHQQAFDLLWKVVSHPWDEYYKGVAQVALNELNALHHTHKDEIDASAVEKSLLRHMPVDLRIVMTWD
ncbi:MAG: VIT domain-containing protein, partial [Verrucomicrobiota bacterium]